jgi:hypothetical protein
MASPSSGLPAPHPIVVYLFRPISIPGLRRIVHPSKGGAAELSLPAPPRQFLLPLVQQEIPLPATLYGGEQDHEQGREANGEAAD